MWLRDCGDGGADNDANDSGLRELSQLPLSNGEDVEKKKQGESIGRGETSCGQVHWDIVQFLL